MKKEKKVKVKTWQVSFFIAAVACICFILLSSVWARELMTREIPNQTHRTIAAALLLAVIVFLFSGLVLHYVCPEKERVEKMMSASPVAVFDR